jgi:hypothetical protein
MTDDLPAIAIEVGTIRVVGRLEGAKAPETCRAFLRLLPLTGSLIQARWSGESGWVPLGDLEVGVGPENATSRPAPGQLLLYPKGVSETEILFPYGQTVFASKHGQLEGNHFLTVVEGREQLAEIGRRVVWQGAQAIRFSTVARSGDGSR